MFCGEEMKFLDNKAHGKVNQALRDPMLEDLYYKLDYPDVCKLDKIIFKKVFMENESLKSCPKTLQSCRKRCHGC